MNRARVREAVVGVIFALAGGAAASFLTVSAVAVVLGLPTQAAKFEPALSFVGYAVWAATALILDALWLRRFRR
jgi:hypothetical protein